MFANSKKGFTFALAFDRYRVKAKSSKGTSSKDGPFVYRLGRKIFILERGVRFPYGLQLKLKNIIEEMANHKSSLKRIRQTEKRNLLNRYLGKNMRSAVRGLRAINDKNEALAKFPQVQKMLDRMAKRGLIHKNKAANLKSGLCAKIAKLA